MVDLSDYPLSHAPLMSVPISQLNPELEKQDGRLFCAVVALVWPFSSSNRTFSLLVADPDVRLRRHNGQVKVIFHNSCAEEVARTRVGIGDEICLGLDGVRWSDNGDAMVMTETGVRWNLHFDRRVQLKVIRNSKCLAVLDFNGLASHPGVSALAVLGTPRLRACNQHDDYLQKENDKWESPTFFKLPPTHLGGAFKPFAEEDGYVAKKGRKRLRFSMQSNEWRFVDEPASPTKSELPWDSMAGSAEDDDSPVRSDGEIGVDSVTRRILPSENVEKDRIQYDIMGQMNNLSATISVDELGRADPDCLDSAESIIKAVSERSPSQVPQNFKETAYPNSPNIVASIPNYAQREDLPAPVTRCPIDTPRLHPLHSPGLPIPSPITSTSAPLDGFFPKLPAPISQEDSSHHVVPTSSNHALTTSKPIALKGQQTDISVQYSSSTVTAGDSRSVVDIRGVEPVQFESSQVACFTAVNHVSRVPSSQDIQDTKSLEDTEQHRVVVGGYTNYGSNSPRKRDVSKSLVKHAAEIADEETEWPILDKAEEMGELNEQHNTGEFENLEEDEGEQEADVRAGIPLVVSEQDRGGIRSEGSEYDEGDQSFHKYLGNHLRDDIGYEMSSETDDFSEGDEYDQDSGHDGKYSEAESGSDFHPSGTGKNDRGQSVNAESGLNGVRFSERPQQTSQKIMGVIVIDSDSEEEPQITAQEHLNPRLHHEDESLRESVVSRLRHAPCPSVHDARAQSEGIMMNSELNDSANSGFHFQDTRTNSDLEDATDVSAESDVSPDDLDSQGDLSIIGSSRTVMDQPTMTQPSEPAIDPELLRADVVSAAIISNIDRGSDEPGDLLERQVSAVRTYGADQGLLLDGSTSPHPHQRVQRSKDKSLHELQHQLLSPNVTQENDQYDPPITDVAPTFLIPTPQATQDHEQFLSSETLPSVCEPLTELRNDETGSLTRGSGAFPLPETSSDIYSSASSRRGEAVRSGYVSEDIIDVTQETYPRDFMNEVPPVEDHLPQRRRSIGLDVSDSSLQPNRYSAGLRSRLSYFAPLASLIDHFNALVDTISIVVETPTIRARSGARDHVLTLQLTDPSMAGTVLYAQIFRPYKLALPAVAEGDAILLRNFKVKSFDHSMTLLSAPSSAWAVFRDRYDDVRVDGPPVEYDSEELNYAMGLRNWFHEDGVAMISDFKLQSSINKDNMNYILSSSPGSSDIGSIDSAERGAGSFLSGRGSRRRRKPHRRITIHELRDGTKYTEIGSPCTKNSIHELRDGTVYAHSFDSNSG